MSLLEKASLVVTPNAYKASKLYSVIPNTTLGDMDVVRATTATRVNSAGFIESVANNVPRIDYTNGSCPSLLVEPQRTNLFNYSNEFENVAWTKNSSTITISSVLSPNNSNSRLYTSLIPASNFLNQAKGTANVVNTFSIFVKKNIGSFVRLNLGSNSSIFNLDNKTSTNVLDTITNYGNGWLRLSITFNPTTNTSAFFSFPSTSQINDSVYIYGAQCELGTYPTSYIPTVASTVTRNADVISKTGINSLIGQTEGTLFVDFYFKTPQSNLGGQIGVKDSAANNRIIIWNNFTLTTLAVQLKANSTNIINNTSLGTFVNNERYKIAIGYKSGSTAVFVNGSLSFQNTSSFTFSSPITDLVIGAYELSFLQEGHQLNNSTQLYKTRLTNTELAQLTTL